MRAEQDGAMQQLLGKHRVGIEYAHVFLHRAFQSTWKLWN